MGEINMGNKPIIKTTKTNIIKPNFEPGLKHLMTSLQQTYPEMKQKDIERIGNDILHNLSESIENKLPFGNLRPRPDGRLELNLWDIKKLGKK